MVAQFLLAAISVGVGCDNARKNDARIRLIVETEEVVREMESPGGSSTVYRKVTITLNYLWDKLAVVFYGK